MMAQPRKKTRHSSGEIGKLIGGPSELPLSDIPTLKEVLAKGDLIQISLSSESCPKDIKHAELVDHLYEAVVTQYKRVNSNLPLITQKSIKDKLLKEWKKYKLFIRGAPSSSKTADYSTKINKIFDII